MRNYEKKNLLAKTLYIENDNICYLNKKTKEIKNDISIDSCYINKNLVKVSNIIFLLFIILTIIAIV